MFYLTSLKCSFHLESLRYRNMYRVVQRFVLFSLAEVIFLIASYFSFPSKCLVVEKLDSEEIFTLTVMIGNEWLIEFFDSSTHVFGRINIDLVLNLLYRARVVEIKISRSKYE